MVDKLESMSLSESQEAPKPFPSKPHCPIRPLGTDMLDLHNGLMPMLLSGVLDRFDKSSAIGKFTYLSIDDSNAGNEWGRYDFPLTFRNGMDLSFVPIRIVEQLFAPRFRRLLAPESYTGPKIKAFPLTPIEAKNWNVINVLHNENRFGEAPFTTADYIISKEDLLELHEFLLFTHDILSSNGYNTKQDFKHCGFVSYSSGANDIPYVVSQEGTKLIPLFYIADPPQEFVANKIILSDGWELAYFRLLFKLQKIKADAFKPNRMEVLDLEVFKKFLPKEIAFNEKTWAPPRGKFSLSKVSPLMVTRSIASQLIQQLPNEGNFSTIEANHPLPDKNSPDSTIVTSKVHFSIVQNTKPRETTSQIIGNSVIVLPPRNPGEKRIGILTHTTSSIDN